MNFTKRELARVNQEILQNGQYSDLELVTKVTTERIYGSFIARVPVHILRSVEVIVLVLALLSFQIRSIAYFHLVISIPTVIIIVASSQKTVSKHFHYHPITLEFKEYENLTFEENKQRKKNENRRIDWWPVSNASIPSCPVELTVNGTRSGSSNCVGKSGLYFFLRCVKPVGDITGYDELVGRAEEMIGAARGTQNVEWLGS